MFKVCFEYREDEEYGGMGWIPKAYPMFNAATGFGLVHDVLEHFPNDEPDLVGEMKAFGSMINIRWVAGWMPYKGYNNHSPEVNMGSDIGNFLRDIHNGQDGRHFRTPPKTYKIDDEYVELVIDGALKKAYGCTRSSFHTTKKPTLCHSMRLIPYLRRCGAGCALAIVSQSSGFTMLVTMT